MAEERRGVGETSYTAGHIVLTQMFRLSCCWLWLALGSISGSFLVTASAWGQAAVGNPGAGSVALDGPWLFHPGDDAGWAAPGLNEGGWVRLQPDAPWGDQGYRGLTGFGWYRRHVAVRGPGPGLSLLIPSVDDNYEVFWNGRSLGVYGGFPPHARLWNSPHPAIYALPGAADESAEGVLAIRVWKMQMSSLDGWSLGGLTAAPVVGSADVLGLMARATESEHEHRFLARMVLSSVVLLAGLISLLLYLRGGREAIYLWLALYLIADAVAALQIIVLWFQVTQFEEQVVNAARALICAVALWFVLLHLFGMAAERRWRRLTIGLGLVMLVAQLVDCAALFFWQFDRAALRWMDGLATTVYTALPAYLFVLLWVGLKRQQRVTPWPLAVALSAYGLYQILVDALSQGWRYTGLHWSQTIDSWTVAPFGYPVGIRVMLDALFLAALLLTMARWQAAERRRQAGLQLEIKSAQEIQRVLVPETLPEVAGFAVDALYQPADEVGGDFFQVLATAEGGVLVVIGDVSGKGLKAAMTVSLVVGAIRTLAEISYAPAMMLNGLNRRLVGRTAGGFTTCLAMHVDAAGRVTLANAGHLPPFVNGRELAVEGSVPLGLVEGMEYEESSLVMHEGDSLMLYTDGLLEARSRAGELYGFERVEELLGERPTVKRVMAEASRFGQEDDITLLSLVRRAQQELARAG